jgi:hypothetical protein
VTHFNSKNVSAKYFNLFAFDFASCHLISVLYILFNMEDTKKGMNGLIFYVYKFNYSFDSIINYQCNNLRLILNI